MEKLAQSNSVCLYKLYTKIDGIMSFKPVFYGEGDVTKDQVDTAVVSYGLLVKKLFNGDLADELTKICN